MSKTPRTPRAKSSGMRSLGAIRLQQGTNVTPLRNDPALTINQILTTSVPIPSATSQVKDFAREREFQNLKTLLNEEQQEKEVSKHKLSASKEREKRLKDDIAALQNIIVQLRQELKLKSETCDHLQTTITVKNEEYQQNLEAVEKEHAHTKLELDSSHITQKELRGELSAARISHEERVQTIIDEYEAKLKELQESKDRELREKDEKLHVLKKRMADTLGKNSMERQHQLEELKRDLVKQSQEARELQQKLKQFQLKPKQCDNCAKLEAMLDDKTLQLRLKEKAINDLQGIGRKMQVQLHQQRRSALLKDQKQQDHMKTVCIRAGIRYPKKQPVNEVEGCHVNYGQKKLFQGHHSSKMGGAGE